MGRWRWRIVPALPGRTPKITFLFGMGNDGENHLFVAPDGEVEASTPIDPTLPDIFCRHTFLHEAKGGSDCEQEPDPLLKRLANVGTDDDSMIQSPANIVLRRLCRRE